MSRLNWFSMSIRQVKWRSKNTHIFQISKPRGERTTALVFSQRETKHTGEVKGEMDDVGDGGAATVEDHTRNGKHQ